MPEWLEREYGGLPVWQWAAILAAGVGLALVLRRSFDGGKGDGPDGFTGDPTQGGFVGLQPTGPGYSPDGSGGIPPSQPEPADDDPDPVDALRTNGAWLEQALDAISPPIRAAIADTALRRYLQGRPLNTEQFNAVDKAIAAVGPPPEGAPAIERAAVERDPGPTGPRPAPNPDKPKAKATPKPRGGWDFVRDNLGAHFVVNWSGKDRYRVQHRDIDEARAIFEGPLTRSSQVPASHRGDQRRLIEHYKRTEGRTLSPDLIYLDVWMGWEERGMWTTQGTR